MFGIGYWELAVIALVLLALLVVGAIALRMRPPR